MSNYFNILYFVDKKETIVIKYAVCSFDGKENERHKNAMCVPSLKLRNDLYYRNRKEFHKAREDIDNKIQSDSKF